MIAALLWALEAAATLGVCGSETLGRTATNWAREWGEREPEIAVETHFPGSGTSLASLENGTCRVALLSREPDATDILTARMALRQVGWDEVVFFVHPSSRLHSLPLSELRRLLAHPSASLPWHIYGRNELSGTHAWVRNRLLGGELFASQVRKLPGPQGVVRAVAIDPQGLGYASRDALHGEVRMLRLTDAQGMPVHLLRPLFLARHRDDALAARFESSALSPRGQALLSQDGLLPVASLSAEAQP